MGARRRLIVNADDFGFTPDVNEGILEAHTGGILTATTLMANGGAFDDAVRRARAHPSLDIGCHLVLVGGRSLLPPHAPLPATVPRLLAALSARRLRIEDELRAQVLKILDTGLRPTHLDTHKHTHLAPPVLDAVARVSAEFGIPWVRRPFDVPLGGAGASPLTRLVRAGLAPLRGRFERVLASRGCRATDHFAGFSLTGVFGARELIALIQRLPSGLTEFMCHPGRCREPLRQARTRLKESRERELAALAAPETRRALEEAEIDLVSYREL
jgi:chitin disaccharide deacetylase